MLPLSRPHAEERAQRASRSMRHGRWPPHPSRRRLLRPSDEAVLVLRAFAQSHAVFFVPAARCCVRVYPSLRMYLRFPVRRQAHEGFGASGRRDSSNSVPPTEGWMERRQAHSWTSVARARRDARACKARTFPVRPGPLSALHRGAFQPRTHAALPGSGTRDVQRLPAPGRQWLAVGVRTSRGTVRAAAAGRHSLLRLVGSFLENAPSEPGCKSYSTNSIRSQ
jgi:hypothetical protein